MGSSGRPQTCEPERVWDHWRRRTCQPGLPAFRFADAVNRCAVLDILFVQCFGDEKRALATVDEMIDAATGQLFGKHFWRRWIALQAWYGEGRPETPSKSPGWVLREYRAMLREHARRALAWKRGAA